MTRSTPSASRAMDPGLLGLGAWSLAMLGLIVGILGAMMAMAPARPQASLASAEARLTIAVSIPPLAWIARGLAPDAQVEVALPVGASPHTFEPGPVRLARLRQADLAIVVGAGFQPSVERAARAAEPRGGIVALADLADVVPHVHAHGVHECSAEHDLHVWLDPDVMRAAVREAHAALTALGVKDIDARADALLAQIDDLQRAYDEALTPKHGAVLLTHHAAYGRLADRYGIEQATPLRPVEAVEPSISAIMDAHRALQNDGVQTIFIEPQFSARAAHRLAELSGVRLLTLDPVGGEDWPATMRANLVSLEAGLVAPTQSVARGAGG